MLCQYVGMTERWPSLLTVTQTAAMLERDPQTVRTLVRNGTLRARKMPGGTYVLRRDQVLVDAEKHRQAVAAGFKERRRRRA